MKSNLNLKSEKEHGFFQMLFCGVFMRNEEIRQSFHRKATEVPRLGDECYTMFNNSNVRLLHLPMKLFRLMDLFIRY